MMTNTETWMKKHSLIAYFTLAYVVTWCIEIPLALSAQGLIEAQIPMAIHYLGAFGPMIAALIVTMLTEGMIGIRALLSRWFKWRVEARYYVFECFLPLCFSHWQY